MAQPSMTDADMAQLLDLAHVHRFADGQFIQHQGDPSDAFWAVISGHVSIGRYAENGELTLFGVIGPGDLFGELAFFTGTPRQVDAFASGDAALVAIDRPLLRTLIAADVGWAELLLRSLSRQLAGTLDIIDAERQMSTPQRVLRQLQVMAGEDMIVTATQQQLADLMGVSRVTMGAVLGQLEHGGHIKRGYGRIDVRGAAVSPETSL
jgi:CRP-like cAMP-binding protein